jgi:hypothetical protein
MSWKGNAHRIYEERVLNDALARLAERFDVEGLPFSVEELRTLARRSRESFRQRKRERLARYKAHLAKSHGAELVEEVSALLEKIHNEIGYEEK